MAAQWSANQPMEQKVTTVTKIVTKKWPSDDYFAKAEAEHRRGEEIDTLRAKELRKRQEVLKSFPRQTHRQPPPPLPEQDPEEEVIMDVNEGPERYREEELPAPPKLTTRVVIKKWPPDSWFEGARRRPPPAASPQSRPPPMEPHHPIPLDPNSKMYNPHGFWPYAQGQTRPKHPAPVMRHLREELYAEGPHTGLGVMAPPTMQPESRQPSYAPRQDSQHSPPGRSPHSHAPAPVHEPMHELGEHFQCLGCGCHIRPSEVVYRPRTVPCLPPAVEHCPVPIQKPGQPPVVIPRPLPRMPSLPPPPPEPEEKVKIVEPFDFDRARQEGLARAEQEKANNDDEYKIKTVENFDFEAAKRAGTQQAHHPPPQAPAEPERVKVVEDFDFDAARRQAPPQPAPSGFNPDALRQKFQAAGAAQYGGHMGGGY